MEPHLDYEADLRIDKHRLDEEWLRQPTLMGRYNKGHAQATFNKNRAKDALEVAKGEMKKVGAELAVMLKEAGGSDTHVSNKVTSHPDYIASQQKYYDAMSKLTKTQYEEDLYFGAVMAFQGRKAALEELVRLYGMDYFSEPKMEGGQSLRAQASQSATEAAIMRSQALNQQDNDGPMWAIGPMSAHQNGFFTNGLFGSEQEALEIIGELGEFIFCLRRSQPAEIVYGWSGSEWKRPDQGSGPWLVEEQRVQPEEKSEGLAWPLKSEEKPQPRRPVPKPPTPRS